MSKIHVLDSIMGSGKSSAAFQYMKDNPDRHFLYITPYLTEVDRACEVCDFSQAEGESAAKSVELRRYLKEKKNVAATHALFFLLDDESRNLIRESGYSLIVDESVDVISQVPITLKDVDVLKENFVDIDSDGLLSWRDDQNDYTGKFSMYKEMIDHGSVWMKDSAVVNILSPQSIAAFDEVIFMTYMFDGQYQRAYLDYYGFEYDKIGIVHSGKKYHIVDKPVDSPPRDYRRLINIVEADRMNVVGNEYYALSKSWFERKKYNSADIVLLRKNMNNFFRNISGGSSSSRLWTTYKDHMDMLLMPSGRFRSNFLSMNLRATNVYGACTDVAYMVNLFPNPNLTKFFADGEDGELCIDRDQYALSSMLQFLWRSAIRNDNSINVYIPSSRMRGLLTEWINTNSEGVCR